MQESDNGPWYKGKEVNIEKPGELADRLGERFEAEPLSAADAANGVDPSVSNRLAADQPGSAQEEVDQSTTRFSEKCRKEKPF